ncbi:protein phosphatase 2C domain-containing protein [Actinomadura sp. NBRC 104412]|uniref:protein phosphatase 2C domain-containing protein n=1 Tax=Actinomadura sp. NBRC 104412 TaxID=3032203 RepID=UPI0025572DDE|nr:protein phosphatase 2C domain-containing protein [Actinomadura sp. NBRC 104412]
MNEDFAVAGPGWAVVLDGATPRPGVDSGCVHGPGWLVRRLGGELAGRLALQGREPLADVLAESIKATSEAHARTCDLDNPDSPSTTVAMLRWGDDAVEWLALADSPLLLDVGAEVRVIQDDRVNKLPSYTTEAVRAARNSPGGFWVASTRPEAADQALTGQTQGVRRAALLSDGAARLVERFGLMTWAELLDLVDDEGPRELIRRTRRAEREQRVEGVRGKRFDDATALLVRFGEAG